jgi:hypothetical protein
MNNSKSVSSAIVAAMKDFYDNIFVINVFIFGKITPHINDVVKNIMTFNNGSFSISILNLKSVNESTTRLSASAVILTSRTKNINRFNRHASLVNNAPVRFRFLIYAEDFNRSTLWLPNYNVSGQLKYGNITQFEYFIVENENHSIDLKAIRSFSEVACHETQFLTLDSFDVENQRWNRSLKTFEHDKQFHGCRLSFLVVYSNLFQFRDFIPKVPELKNEKAKTMNEVLFSSNKSDLQYDGLLFEVIVRMQKISNFTLIFKIIDPNVDISKQITLDRTIDKYIMVRYTSEFSFAPEFFLSQSIATDRYQFVFTPTVSFSNFEKLFLCFDRATWIVIGLIFGITFLSIFIVNQMPQSIQDIFYGTKVRMPSYNVLGTFFGISQQRLPRESFARCLLIFFVFFCFMVRTLYQSMMFDFIATDMRKPIPDSFDEIIAQNYTIVHFGGVNKSEIVANPYSSR